MTCGENDIAAQRELNVHADVWPGWHGPGAGPSELRLFALAAGTVAATAISTIATATPPTIDRPPPVTHSPTKSPVTRPLSGPR